MKKELVRKIITLFFMAGLLALASTLLAGCERKRCVKSHTKQSMCSYPIYNGKMVTVTMVPCLISVCDEYEAIENAK